MRPQPRNPKDAEQPSECLHQWVLVECHYLGGVAHKLQRCRRCALERLVRRSDGKVVAAGPSRP